MTTTRFHTEIDSPLGRLFVVGDGQFVTGLYLPDHKHWRGLDAVSQQSDHSFITVREQLTEYFAGARQTFNVPLKLAGTPFQQRVWQELTRIPFGTTLTYAHLAERIGHPNAARAVGAANGRNPVSLLVPCHRVIGSSGKLTGYAGGVDRKAWLLVWERSQSTSKPRDLFSVADRSSSKLIGAP